MRDYLLVQIELQNSHRSGVAANLLLDEFHNSQVEGDYIHIKVKNHKTRKDYGPAKVYFQPHVFSYMKIFVDNVRTLIPDSVLSKVVFVSFNGKAMESGAISKQLNSVWRRAGVYQDMKVAPKRNMTTTMFRKSISTEVANLLAHSEKTQRKYYNARRMDLSTA